MVLTRKVRRSGRGLVLTVPSQVAQLIELREGDAVAFEVVDDRAGVLRLRKTRLEEREA